MAITNPQILSFINFCLKTGVLPQCSHLRDAKGFWELEEAEKQLGVEVTNYNPGQVKINFLKRGIPFNEFLGVHKDRPCIPVYALEKGGWVIVYLLPPDS